MKVLDETSISQLKQLDSEAAKLDKTIKNLTDSLKKFNLELSHNNLAEFNSGIIQLSNSVSILAGKFIDCTDSQKTGNDALERYRDTMKGIDEFLANSFLKHLDETAGSIEVFGINIIDASAAVMELLGALYSIATFMAVVKALSEKTFTGLINAAKVAFSMVTTGVAAMGRAFAAALGPGSIAAGAVMFIMGLVEHTAMLLSNISLWQNRIENNTQTISSTQPGQDNLKYVKYSDEVSIMPFEQSSIKFDVEPENNAVIQEQNNSAFSGIKEKKIKNFSPGFNFGSSHNFISEYKEQLNLVKLQEIELDKVKKKLEANLGDVGAEIDLRKQILDIEREISRLKTGVDLNNLPGSKTSEDIQKIIDSMPGIQKRSGIPFLNQYTPREKQMQEKQEEERIMQDISRYANDMWGNFQGMLQATGLMKGQFGQIISFINSFISSISSGVSFFESLIGFIGSLVPGGSAVAGLASGGGLNIGNMPSGLPRVSVPERNDIPYFSSSTLQSNMKYNIEMPEVRLKGSDLYLSWRRQKTIQDKRTQ